jgi:hypothetical protein
MIFGLLETWHHNYHYIEMLQNNNNEIANREDSLQQPKKKSETT